VLFCLLVLEEALESASVKIEDIGLISYSHGPGLSPSLVVGKNFAKELAEKYSIPIIGVNHCVAHLTIGKLITETKNPLYIYVSGVNTQVIALTAGRFRIMGETLDIGLGNALDKFGREAQLGFPAGPKIEELAKKGKYVELNYAVKGMDVSFSGMVTKLSQLLKKGIPVEDLCFSMQETSFAMLCEITERAMAHSGNTEVILIGGVAANKKLCSMLSIMCKERGGNFYPVPLQYCGDQGAMIAWQGVLQYVSGKERLEVSTADIHPYERTDDVEVSWT